MQFVAKKYICRAGSVAIGGIMALSGLDETLNSKEEHERGDTYDQMKTITFHEYGIG